MDPSSERLAEESPVEYRPHVGESRQYVRDIILGVNDGLVSTFLLVAGVVGGGLATGDVLLTAVAGALAGAVSMAAGEYLATRSQEEVFDREIALEREHIAHFRAREVDQLRDYFADIGVRPEDIEATVAAFSHDDEVVLNAMKVFEFGIVDSERRKPGFAMITSGLLFLLGALPSTVPFVFAGSANAGLIVAAVLTGVGLFAVGAAKTVVTDGSLVRSGLQNLVIAGLGGFLAYGIGTLFGIALA